MFSPRSASRQQSSVDVKPSTNVPMILATNIATEYASLSAPGACPRGIYITPCAETLLIWEGVMFIHDGPYADAILRFTITFELDFPKSRPVIKFGPDVYHHPKTLVWSSRNTLARWQPGRDHVVHLIKAMRDDFKSTTLDNVREDEAINKQLFLLYKNSRHTFISMTAQRSRQSSAPTTLFPGTAPQEGQVPPSPTTPTSSTASKTAVAPSTPTKKGHVRMNSGISTLTGKGEEKEGMIRFKKLDPEDEEKLKARIQSKYGKWSM